MPGSYSLESVLADVALDKLKQAYHGKETQDVGKLILDAFESISKLKQAIIEAPRTGVETFDPYEISESNSAV